MLWLIYPLQNFLYLTAIVNSYVQACGAGISALRDRPSLTAQLSLEEFILNIALICNMLLWPTLDKPLQKLHEYTHRYIIVSVVSK